MVKSQTTSITPSQHAANHVAGGTDPLYGSMNIIFSGCFSPAKKCHTGNYNIYTKVKEILLNSMKSSTLNITFQLFGSESDKINYGRIYRNGVAVGTVRSGTVSGFIAIGQYTESIPGWADGDLLQLYVKSNHNVAGRETCVNNLYVQDVNGSVQDP